MFSWGNKVPLAETLGLNTLRYRENRDAFVKSCSDLSSATVARELSACSTKTIEPEAKFDFASADFQKKIVGLATASDAERSRILTNVVAKLKEEKLEVGVEGSVLCVKWTVPVAPPAPVTTPAPILVPVEAEKVAEPVADDKNKK